MPSHSVQFESLPAEDYRLCGLPKSWFFFGYSMPNADFEFRYLLNSVQLAERIRPRITVITGGAGASDTVKFFFGDLPGERRYFCDGLTDECLVTWVPPE